MGSMQWQLGREMGTIPAFASRTQENQENLCQQNPCITCNLNTHCRIHNRPTPVPILSYKNAVNASLSHLLKIGFNIISLVYVSAFQAVAFPQASPSKPRIHLFHPCYFPRTSLFFIYRILFGEEYSS